MWFVPVMCVVAGVVLSIATLGVDRAFSFDAIPRWLTGDPDAATAILQTIAASMVSLAALVLTITMVVVQLAMGQFSPRIVQNFLRDKPSQFAIGLFVATFAYAMISLREVQTDVYLWELKASDLERLPKRGWTAYLASADAAYPLAAFQQGLEEIRRTTARLRADTSTPDFPPHATRGAGMNPVSTGALINLTLGGNDPNGSGHGPLPLHTQLRHFDPDRRRAGLPEDVAALVERITPEGVTLTLVNTSPFHARTVTIQAGGYGEHHFTTVAVAGRTIQVDAPFVTVRLVPGAHDTLTMGMRRYAHQPTLAFPWDRTGTGDR